MKMIRAILRLATLYGLVAPIVILDCITRFSSPVYAMFHGPAATPPVLPPDLPLPPDDFGASSTGTLLGIIAATVIAGVIGLVIIRIATWFLLSKTGWLGREFGRAIIRGILEITGTRGKNWKRDWIVRTIYKDVNGRRLKSLAVIRKHCMTEDQIAGLKATNDNRKPRKRRNAA